MKFRLLFLLSALLIISCKRETVKKESLLGYLPANPALILKINNISNFKSELKNNSFLEAAKDLALNKVLSGETKALEHISSDGPCLLAIYETGKSKYDYVLVSKKNPDFFDVEEVQNKTVETLSYQNSQITQYTLDERIVFAWQHENQVLLSSSQLLMENMVRTKKGNPVDATLEKLYQTAGIEKSATLFINLMEDNSILNNDAEQGQKEHPFSEWASLDFNASFDALSLNGVAMASDSIKSFINLFKGTSPLVHKTYAMAPLTSQAVVSFTFDDYQIFANNQNKYLDRVKPVDSLFQTIEEVGIIYLNGQKAVVLHSYGTDSLSEFLENNKTSTQTYQGSEIKGLSNPKMITEGFAPLVERF